MSLAGLPEGVEAVSYGDPAENQFYLSNGFIHRQGPKVQAVSISGNSTLIVQPAQGYTFMYDISTNRYVAVKLYDQAKGLTATFSVTTSNDEATVRNNVAKLPGFQDIQG